MKLCILTHIFPARSETFVLEHVLGMARRGYQVTVIARSHGGTVQPHELTNLDKFGVSVVYLGERTSRIRDFFSATSIAIRYPKASCILLRPDPWTLRNYLSAFRAARVIAKLEPDLVHIHFGTHAARLQRLAEFFGNFPPTVVTWHGYDANVIPLALGRNIYRELFKADTLHTVGSSFMHNSIQHLGAQPSKIYTIPMGIDLMKFSFREKVIEPGKPLQILSVGRLDEMKGHRFLIEAVKLLLDRADTPIILRIIGDGPLRNELQQQIDQAKLADRVDLLGSLPSERVAMEMQRADIFALAGVEASNGRVETQGVVFAEAQATGLPVIGCNVGGVSESMVDSETGIICPASDPKSIASAIYFFARNTNVIARYGLLGRQFVEKRFSIEAMLNRFEDLYQDIVR